MLYLQTFLALAAVLGVVWLFYRGFLLLQDKLPQSMRPTKNIQVVERVSLGDKRTLLLVETAGRRFLLGSTPHQVSLVSDLGETSGKKEAAADAAAAPAGDFRLALQERLQ